MPFDHLIVVMMENHSFDNLLGALSLTRPDVCGLEFVDGEATNSNPGSPKTPSVVKGFRLADTSQGDDVDQSWQRSHEQINGGRMDGFVTASNSTQPMGYYPPGVLPFAYSLASTFTLANCWFCSLPGPTYPNRRFLLAGTAYGCIVTNKDTLLDPEPPNGTVFDLLTDHHISWANYFTDVPMSEVIARNFIRHLGHHHSMDKFRADCGSGNLPAVSFVDPGFGPLSRIGRPISQLPFPFDDALRAIGADISRSDPAETQEDPQSMYYGEAWAHGVITAVLQSPKWERICLIYTYDEHGGGYYDHVVPLAAIPPDNIPPVFAPGDPRVGFVQYGPRVPAIVVSPHSKPAQTTNELHDHTSVLATIEAKWNLPALTRRDANANDIMDFLDPNTAAFAQPPELVAPSSTGPSGPTPPAHTSPMA
jgi:phospholipase C